MRKKHGSMGTSMADVLSIGRLYDGLCAPQTTGGDHNEGTLYRTRARAESKCGMDWHQQIRHLHSRGHAFAALRFSAAGYLFRGMSEGVEAALQKGRFEHFADNGSLAALERALGVYFLSHQIEDALSVARLPDGGNDRGVLVIPSRVFNDALEARRAAVLAYAEGGQVFHYPFLLEGIELSDIACLIVEKRCTPTCSVPVYDYSSERATASDVRQDVATLLERLKLKGAVPQPSTLVPG